MCVMGGWPTLDIVICCYVTDLSDEKNRTFRLGVITFLNFLGSFSAYLSSSFILASTNATFVFTIAFCCASTAFIYTVFFVDESVRVTEDGTAYQKFKEIFSITRIKEIVASLIKKRSYKERRMICILIATITLVVFTMHGNGTVNYLFVREKFGWALREWTIFDSTNTVISVLGLFIGLVVLKKFFEFSDTSLALLSLTSAIIEATFKAFAAAPYQLYMASALGAFRLLTGPVFRSMQANVLPHHEIGKVFSATTSFEAFCGLGAGPLYSNVYKKTFTTFPGAFHLISASIFVVDLILTLFVVRWKSARDGFLAQRQN